MHFELGVVVADFVFEIGSEEMPAGYIEPALSFLSEELSGFFKKSNIGFESIKVTGTPRRLFAGFSDVDTIQPDRTEIYHGPKKDVAFDQDGNLTKAGAGFARSKGVEEKALTVEATEKGDVVTARVDVKGLPTEKLLTEYLPKLVLKLPFPKKMRWGARSEGYARPLHWIVAVLDEKILPFSVAGIDSGLLSRGHRFLDPETFEFESIDGYLEECEKHSVIVSIDSRKEMIVEQMNQLAEEVDGFVMQDESLLSTVTNLVEYPVALRGEFSSEYLDLPKELLIITMKQHQKYFPVLNEMGDLLPHFITISNMPEVEDELIVRGNQRVLKARLEDAKFFFEEDKKITLESRIPDLKGVLFQKSLGSLLNKVERMETLIGRFKDTVHSRETIEKALRAARLCKVDLVSQMVFEFPELQGIMGGYYARHFGEDPEVADAIKEHYRPQFAGDELPKTLTAALVALADKLDTIVACIAVKLIPTGSEDPYALRRHATGILQILIKYDLNINLDQLISWGIETLGDKAQLSRQEIETHAKDLFNQRLKTHLANKNLDHDVIDSAFATDNDSMQSLLLRAEALQELKQLEIFDALSVAFKRVIRILDEKPKGDIDEKLLSEDAELALFEDYRRLFPVVSSLVEKREYRQALSEIVQIKPAVDRFFDEVMVNVEDKKIQANRKSLLGQLAALFSKLADFSKLVPRKN